MNIWTQPSLTKVDFGTWPCKVAFSADRSHIASRGLVYVLYARLRDRRGEVSTVHGSDSAGERLGFANFAFIAVNIIQNSERMDALATGNLTGSQRDELMQQVKQQIAVANAQELLTVSLYNVFLSTAQLDWLKVTGFYAYLQKMTEKCFKKCIGKPGTSLDSSEQVIFPCAKSNSKKSR